MSSRFLILPLVFAFVAWSVKAEDTPQWCDIPLPNKSNVPECGSNEFLSISIGGNGLSANENPCTFIKSCQPAHQPPSQVSLQCTDSGNGFTCGAWPRGETAGDFSYDWLAIGPLAVGQVGPSESPNQTVTCTGGGDGFLSVVVTSPFGLSSTQFVAINCKG